MLSTGLPDNSATVFVTMSLTEGASIEAGLYVHFELKRKALLLALSVHAPSVMVVSVVKTVRASSVVTVSVVAETVVAATVVAAVVVTAAVTCNVHRWLRAKTTILDGTGRVTSCR